MEFKLTTDLQKELPVEIDFNFIEIKNMLQERLEHYKNLAITEDTIKEGKEDRATLNKLRTAIDTRRKEVKKQYMAPFNAFEDKTKELLALVSEPIMAIDGQLNNFEEKRKAEKMTEIADLYDSMVDPEIEDIIPLDRIMSSKWLNSTMSIKKVGEELETIIKRTNADLMLINTVEPQYAAAVREAYIATMDIEAAMRRKEALIKADDAFGKQKEAKREREVAPPAPEPEIKQTPANEDEPVYILRLELQVTQQQAKDLKSFLTENGIYHTKI